LTDAEERTLRVAKKRLFESIRAEVSDERVLRAMERVPREHFVPADLRNRAYEDSALPIGRGQTISQPLMVAIMVSALMVRRSKTVLEVGTGSGYQAALLAGLAGRVVSVERLSELSAEAGERLAGPGYSNVALHLAVSELGWPARAPSAASVVAAGAPRLPRNLMDQLAPGGRLVVPVGPADTQELMRVTRGPRDFSIHTLGGCRFVPLIGDGAWAEDDPELTG
jgi:protein-L-isoaspartate(D-aspartate) O-methyltransferase